MLTGLQTALVWTSLAPRTTRKDVARPVVGPAYAVNLSPLRAKSHQRDSAPPTAPWQGRNLLSRAHKTSKKDLMG